MRFLKTYEDKLLNTQQIAYFEILPFSNEFVLFATFLNRVSFKVNTYNNLKDAKEALENLYYNIY